MRQGGLVEVAGRRARASSARPRGKPGSVVLAAMEGTRPLLVEVQALVSPRELVPPRRVCNGIDRNRLALVLAVLARHAGVGTGTRGRVRQRRRRRARRRAGRRPGGRAGGGERRARRRGGDGREPLACFGEIGLTGELRSVAPRRPPRRGGCEVRARAADLPGDRADAAPRAAGRARPAGGRGSLSSGRWTSSPANRTSSCAPIARAARSSCSRSPTTCGSSRPRGAIPGRRFDWDRREWFAPVDDWVGAHVADILARFPELEPSDEAATWLRGLGERWIGAVGTARHDGRGWFVLRTRAGELPEAMRDGRGRARRRGTTRAAGRRRGGGDRRRARRAARRRGGALPDGARARARPAADAAGVTRDVDGARLGLDVLWDHDAGAAFEQLPGAEAGRRLPLDPWVIEPLDAFLGMHGAAVDGPAAAGARRSCAPSTTRRPR